MKYHLVVPKPVQKQLSKLPEKVYRRIYAAILELADDPRPLGILKLQGIEGQYRIRVGDFRIIYTINDQELIVLIIKVVNRKDAYKD